MEETTDAAPTSDAPEAGEMGEPRVLLHELGSCRVERQGDIVSKTSSRVSEAEKAALDLVQSLHIPTPRSLGFEKLDSNLNLACLSMTYLEGEQLDKVWPSMTPEQKKDVALQIRDILTAIRSLKPDSPIIASADGGPVNDCRRIVSYKGGPFHNEEAFNYFLLDLISHAPKNIERAFKKRMRTDHRIVFAHGDLSQHNFLVKGPKIVGLIDWEFAGWYPEYWDYVKFFERYSDNRDWRDYADDIFAEQYDDELAHYQAVCRWQKP